MSPFSCSREREVAEQLQQGFWPQACPADLRDHARGCRICSERILVEQAFLADRKLATQIPRLEPSGALWWRAQLRKRSAAIDTMSRPILGAQLFAMAMAVVVGAGLLIWQASNWRSWIEALPGAMHLNALLPTVNAHSSSTGWIIVPVLASLALLSGAVVYLATEKQ
jgi:hypothetical protein